MTTISFFAAGIPVAQPRHRARVMHTADGKPYAMVYNPNDADLWKRDIKMASRPYVPDVPIVGPVHLELTFYLPRIKGHFGTGKNEGKLKAGAPMYHEVKPDIENAVKALMDVMTEMRFWRDDCQVSRLWVDKLYETHPIVPGCQITLTPLENKTAGVAARTIFTDAQPALIV